MLPLFARGHVDVPPRLRCIVRSQAASGFELEPTHVPKLADGGLIPKKR